jgi:NitT/TauT family transport system permease protein
VSAASNAVPAPDRTLHASGGTATPPVAAPGKQLVTTSRKAKGPEPEGRISKLLHSERFLLGAVGVVGFLLLWEAAARAGAINTAFFASPTMIVTAGIAEVQTPQFWANASVSAYEFFVGYGAAILLGVPLGLMAGWFVKLNYALDPWLNFFNALPRVALLPVLVIIFGLGIQSKIAVVFLGAFFSVIIPTVQGVRTVDRKYLDVATSFRANKRLLFTSVVGLATVPFIVTGLRLGMARGLIGVVTGELYAATEGLGVMIRRASEARQGDRMLFGVLLFTFAGIVGVEIIRAVERRFQKWRPEGFRR